MNDSNLYRVYDEKLDLLYEVSVKPGQKERDVELKKLLRKSQLFLTLENLTCYRIVPDIK
ncbi:MAG: hypothetical protein MJA30_27720 [Cytophagales bacterium]|nr:hypothetical protein [Cytophagales bacterium]